MKIVKAAAMAAGVLAALGFAGPGPARAQSSAHPGGVVDTGCGPWNLHPAPMTPVNMDDVTVFAMSQVPCGQSDPQVLELAPDLVWPGWVHWHRWGVKPSDYDFKYVADCHARHILFIGGTTATVLFSDELPPSEFDRAVTRDASGRPVPMDRIQPGAYHGSLADPGYRAYLEKICEIQIDGGVDGLFFDEPDHDYEGAAYDNNEGFDDWHLADFNSYLLAKYPPGTDFARRFEMPPGNVLRRDLPAWDLRRNFNYLRYLAFHGWSRAPFNPANPLAAEWGRSYDDHPEPGCRTFVSAAEPYRYFRKMVRDLKAYARRKYGRSLLVCANGILPNVDFECIGLWDGNHDGKDGAMADYVPVKDGHLDGTVSLQDVFRRFRARSRELAPGAAVMVDLDWPTPTFNRYAALPFSERRDYWRLYGAEAYANGIFFSFFLHSTLNEPTAAAQGLMPFFKKYTAFYRAHADFYHRETPSSAAVSVSAPHVMTAAWRQSSPRRLLVHLVNHNYDRGFLAQDKVTVRVPLAERPSKVTEASPDLASDIPLEWRYKDGTLSVELPELVAYSVVVVDDR